ncbi:hypothetical protein ACS0TY_019469 [Phlomoides rotata]
MKNSSAASSMAAIKYAVVTGGNKGIGLEICRQLACEGISVVLTSRSEKRGLEAVEKLKKSGVSDNVMFHQLDVTDSASIDSLAEFIKSRIGKLDILVNNAGASDSENGATDTKRTYELAVGCFQTNYYGIKRTTERLLPLLELSDSPTIVNVTSIMGALENIHYKWGRDALNNVENLTEEKIDEVVNEFLKNFKEGSPEAKGWPSKWSAYCVSKAVANAYTRLIAKRYPRMMINCLSPGWVNTDLSNHTGPLTPQEGAENVVRLVLLPENGPSGLFYDQLHVSPY